MGEDSSSHEGEISFFLKVPMSLKPVQIVYSLVPPVSGGLPDKPEVCMLAKYKSQPMTGTNLMIAVQQLSLSCKVHLEHWYNLLTAWGLFRDNVKRGGFYYLLHGSLRVKIPKKWEIYSHSSTSQTGRILKKEVLKHKC